MKLMKVAGPQQNRHQKNNFFPIEVSLMITRPIAIEEIACVQIVFGFNGKFDMT